MGLTYADIELISADDLSLSRRGYLDKTKIKRIKVKALVDSVSLNEEIKIQLARLYQH
jgi:hypothetical protein